ncbi:transcriptional regulator, AraC family [Caldimonas brevitalea]|uniref:Transcriptional regulator, AraC family n=1 Tax=Caldimonas brevitalea TaxID=413882 RepID=A0A0G3BGU5_9BURK|nr:transcriptional regulator, AraC family [Caldimonas brevitalea]
MEACWTYTATRAGEQLVTADGRIDVLLRARLDPDGLLSRASLCLVGPADRSARIPVAPGDFLAGLRFRLGWGAICLGLPAASLRNTWVADASARERLGAKAAPLLTALHAEAAVAALQRLGEQLGEGVALQPWQRDALTRMAALQADLGTLHSADRSRSGRRHALALAGMPFATLARVLRFQHAMRLLDEGPDQSLAELACVAGYADQSHLCRDFRRFGGYTPRRREAAPPTWRHRGRVAVSFKT